MSLRLRALRAGDDAGITLMELLVAMVINVIIGALTVGIFVSVNDSSNNSVDRAVGSANARNTIQDWTALLRVADGKTAGVVANRIEWLTSKDMLFYADLNNRSTTNLTVTGPPTMVWLRLDSKNVLIQEQFPSTATAGTAPTVCLRLAGTVSTPPATPLFTALDFSSTPMTGVDLGSAPTPSAGCQPLPVTVPSQSSRPDAIAQSNLQKVVTVRIDFVVRDTKGLHPIEFVSQAVLPALGGV
jgi:type II secretory pathway component PulJ